MKKTNPPERNTDAARPNRKENLNELRGTVFLSTEKGPSNKPPKQYPDRG